MSPQPAALSPVQGKYSEISHQLRVCAIRSTFFLQVNICIICWKPIRTLCDVLGACSNACKSKDDREYQGAAVHCPPQTHIGAPESAPRERPPHLTHSDNDSAAKPDRVSLDTTSTFLSRLSESLRSENPSARSAGFRNRRVLSIAGELATLCTIGATLL